MTGMIDSRLPTPTRAMMGISSGKGPIPTPGAMRKQHHLTVRTSLPRHLPPQAVVDSLRTYVPVIKHQALVTHFERGTAPPTCDADPFFHGENPPRAPGHRRDASDTTDPGYGGPFASFNVYERIPLIPGIASKEISFPVAFQDVPDGVRCRADAPGGVTLWTEFKVRPKGPGSDGESGGDASSGEGSGWSPGAWEAEVDRRRGYELVEEVTVETNTLLMPFVARSMEGAHREICRKVLDEVAVRFSWE